MPDPTTLIHDISPPLSPRLAVWPGDTPLSRHVKSDIALGDDTTLSSLSMTVHAGSHADAPCHYGPGGRSIDQQPLDLYIGPCQVVRVDVPLATRIAPDMLPGPVTRPRILFATGTFPDTTRFNEDFAALDPSLIDHLADCGVRLIGIDTPSVDLFNDERLQSHQRCFARDIAILEVLRLEDIPSGEYELIAPPLRLAGFDASPIRALLRPL